MIVEIEFHDGSKHRHPHVLACDTDDNMLWLSMYCSMKYYPLCHVKCFTKTEPEQLPLSTPPYKQFTGEIPLTTFEVRDPMPPYDPTCKSGTCEP